jgi:glycosyltransferase involved in cell wall biosynthesis
MHIAWLGKKSPFCGNVTYGREVTNALLDRGHQVSFLHFAEEDPPPDNWPDFHEVSLPFLYKSQVYTVPSPKSSKVLRQSLENLRPDVVHASLTLSPLDFLLPEICSELNLPLVATFHPPFDRKLRNFTSGTQHLAYQLYAPFLARYDRTVVFSHLQKDLLMKLHVPGDRVAVIPNGVDSVKYSPGPSPLKAELDADRIFIYQGRISPEKNVESLLKAWKQSEMGLGDRTKLVIVGNHGTLANSLMSTYGPEQGVVWMGFIADENRRIEILRGSDVFVLPSLVEGLSLSLLEAMACGLACVATDAGADGEVLETEAGVILETHNVAVQLKTLLPQLRDHRGWTEMMGQNARIRAKQRYTLTHNISQLESLYREVCQRRPSPHLTPARASLWKQVS